MKEYKVEIDVRPIKQGREVKIKVSVPPDNVGVSFFRICPAGTVRSNTLDLINMAFGEVFREING